VAKKRTGFIMTKAEAVIPGKGEGHPNQKAYAFLRPDTSLPPVGKSPSMSIDLALNNIQPGGGIEEHYHEYNKDMPIFDHVYYVISGRIKATMGDEERIVGADSLIYCPSDQRHSITNVGKGLAKILRISGCNDGARMGGPVWSKMPSGELNAHNWKLADAAKPAASTKKSKKTNTK
jgi:mannose-6-phosphate isomerase-like protein (cupin superfamily)